MAQEQAPPGGDYTAKKEPLPPGTFLGKEGRLVKQGRVLSRYGLTGDVFLGSYQDKPDELVAIKVAKWQPFSPGDIRRDFRHEAAILKILTKHGVPHIPRLHHYEPGRAQSPPYIIMDYAKGEILHHFSTDRAFDEQTALEATKQISEGLQAAHQAGINCNDMKSPGGNTIWDPEAHQAVIIDWGAAKSNVKSDNTYMAHWVAAVFPHEYVYYHKQEPLISPAAKALVKLDRVLKTGELTAAKRGSTVVFEYTSADSASGDQIFEVINRILANESSSGLDLDIDDLTKTKSVTINDDEPVDLGKLTTVEKIPERLLGQDFLLAHINSISPEQMPHYWGLKFSGWSSPYNEAKLSSLDQMKWMIEQDSIPQLVLPSKFIFSVMKQFINEGQSYIKHPIWSGVTGDERERAFQNMTTLFQDIMLLTLRPDIATTGNRNRLKENLGKLGQLLDLSTLDNIEEIQKLTEAVTPPSAESVPELTTLKSLMENIRNHPQRDRLSALAALVKTQATVVPSPAEPPPEVPPTAPPEEPSAATTPPEIPAPAQTPVTAGEVDEGVEAEATVSTTLEAAVKQPWEMTEEEAREIRPRGGDWVTPFGLQNPEGYAAMDRAREWAEARRDKGMALPYEFYYHAAIDKALHEGQPVPHNVVVEFVANGGVIPESRLADYPDLAVEAKAQTPEAPVDAAPSPTPPEGTPDPRREVAERIANRARELRAANPNLSDQDALARVLEELREGNRPGGV